jgi:hypothetical protein
VVAFDIADAVRWEATAAPVSPAAISAAATARRGDLNCLI